MDLKAVQRTWNGCGETDPLWAILADPRKRGGKWGLEEFLRTGEVEVRALMERVRSLGLQTPAGRALDFGCGVGRLTQALAPHFSEVIGVDIAPSMLDLARRYNHNGEKCRYHLNERPDLSDFPDGHFDFILSLITLQHMEPRYSRQYIEEFLRVLRHDGMLVFDLCSGHTGFRGLVRRAMPKVLLAFYRKVRHGRQPTIEMHMMKSSEIAVLIEDHGGKLAHVEEDWRGAGWISCRYYVVKQGRTGAVRRAPATSGECQ